MIIATRQREKFFNSKTSAKTRQKQVSIIDLSMTRRRQQFGDNQQNLHSTSRNHRESSINKAEETRRTQQSKRDNKVDAARRKQQDGSSKAEATRQKRQHG